MKIKNIKTLYVGCIVILIFLVILTPLLITKNVPILDEEILESVIIGFLFVAGFIINRIYERELKIREDYLQDAWGHIGEINLLTEAFKDAMLPIDKYPENKKEMKDLLTVMAEKILSMINSPFILIRILLTDEIKTLVEHLQTRNNSDDFKIKISDKQLVENDDDNQYEVISSSAKNIKIKVFCIFPKNKMDSQQREFIQKIASDLAMLYMIFNSEFYKK